MYTSKCLVSKKGPLGAIWVAAYFFKKMKKSQISETNISSSVDNILQNQLEILAYRVLAYLLLGVVRIYSKKVEYLFDDCQEVLFKINEFVVREKNRAKEALRATSFSITRPLSFDLDAFDLEVLEDTSRDNAVLHEQITLKDVARKSTGTSQYFPDRIAALDDDFLMDYTPTEDLSCHPMNFETKARTVHDVCDLEASMEKLRYDNSSHEKVSHLKTFNGVEEEPPNLVKVFNINDREHAEAPDMAGLENHMNREGNRERYNDRFSLEGCANLHIEAELDSSGPFKLKPLAEDQTYREMMKGPDQLKSGNEMNQAMEEYHKSILEASAEIPDIAGSASREKCDDRFPSEEGVDLHTVAEDAEEEPLIPVEPLVEDQGNREKMKGSVNELHQVMEEDHVSTKASIEVPVIADSENHIGREANRDNYNDESCQEEYLNLTVELGEKSPALIKSFGEEQTEREKMKGLDRLLPENEVHCVMEEECNLGASVKNLQTEGFSHMDFQELSSLVVRPLIEEIHTDAVRGKFLATRTSKDRKCRVAAKDRPLSVTLDTTPQCMMQDASGATTPHFMLIPTPARKELARFSRKRKCLFDDVIVFPNDIMRQWIKDASDLVSKRVKDRRTALDARKTCWISNLPQSFSEPSVPCTSELKSIYCGRRSTLLESLNIIKPPEQMDTSESPPVGGSFEQAEFNPPTVEMRDPPDMLNLSKSPQFDGSSEQAGIALQTPIQQSTSLVVGEQTEIAPQTPVLHSKSSRPFRSPKDLKYDNLEEVGPENVDPTRSMAKQPTVNELVERESSSNKNEDLDLNLDMHSNEDDKQGQDGRSSRTRLVEKRLQRSFLDQRKKGEEEKVNLSQLLEGKTKKSSARFFYEILVLKSKGIVDVQQEDAFDDILVLKAPRWTDVEL